MAKEIENLTLGVVNSFANQKEGAYVSDDLFVSMNSPKINGKLLAKYQPYRVGEGRVIRVTSGQATAVINLERIKLHDGLLVVVPKSSIFEILEISEDFSLQVFSYQDFPDENLFTHCTVFNLNTDEWLLSGEYFQLIWHEVNRRQVVLTTIHYLQAALLNDLKAIYNKDNVGRKMSRQEKIFHDFIDLVNENGLKEHNQKFYADKLCVTPSHLGFVIKQTSGETIMTWIDRNIIMHAKSMLKYSDKMVYEIADELNFPNPSFFNRFFKRHTGMTPLEYRKI